MQIPPIRKEYGKWVRNDEQKAGRFANHLKKYFNHMNNKKVKQLGKQQSKKKTK
jgi:hypothetical protein